MDMVKDKG